MHVMKRDGRQRRSPASTRSPSGSPTSAHGSRCRADPGRPEGDLGLYDGVSTKSSMSWRPDRGQHGHDPSGLRQAGRPPGGLDPAQGNLGRSPKSWSASTPAATPFGRPCASGVSMRSSGGPREQRQDRRRIDYERDFTFDYLGFCTLKKSYLQRSRARSSSARSRCGCASPSVSTVRTSTAPSTPTTRCRRKLFTHATPTLFNAGTPKAQMSSCFLLHMHDDSIDGIFKTLTDCAKISQAGRRYRPARAQHPRRRLAHLRHQRHLQRPGADAAHL